MYKFVNTLNDAKPWVEHFRKQIDSPRAWKTHQTNPVVILKSDLKKQGVDDAKKIDAVGEVEQATKQALASLTRQIAETGPLEGPRPRKIAKRANTQEAKKTAVRATRQTKDIFEKYRAVGKKK